MKDKISQGEKKILLQFKRIIERSDFQEVIVGIRSNLSIPKNGLKPTKSDIANITNPNILPEFIRKKFPWKGEQNHLHPKQIAYRKEVRKIETLMPFIVNYYMSLLLRNYIYFNGFYDELLKNSYVDMRTSNVCLLEIPEYAFYYYSMYFDPDGKKVNDVKKRFQDKFDKYPHTIFIHRDASQRDVLAFIKNNWSIIEEVNKEYPVKLSASIKSSKIGENKFIKDRNNFIYKYRHLKSKEIANLLGEKFGSKGILDRGHIRKIISLENKKRNK